jgi:hypothetical protein
VRCQPQAPARTDEPHSRDASTLKTSIAGSAILVAQGYGLLETIKRRHFVGGWGATLLAALEWSSLSAFAATPPHGDYAFFDERFEKARRMAASWAASIGPVAVQGDITPWINVLDRAPRERPLQLRGVTTESFRFCAAILVGDHAHLDLQFSRLDQDLVLWTMRTTPKLKAERSNG